jgi:hypothetical protein
MIAYRRRSIEAWHEALAAFPGIELLAFDWHDQVSEPEFRVHVATDRIQARVYRGDADLTALIVATSLIGSRRVAIGVRIYCSTGVHAVIKYDSRWWRIDIIPGPPSRILRGLFIFSSR